MRAACEEQPCPCTSSRPYAHCCRAIHADIRAATAPEQVVRARFSARVLGNIDFFRLSIIRRYRQMPSLDELAATIGRERYEAVTIVSSRKQGWFRQRAVVVCRIYESGRKHVSAHTERIHLKREDRAWRVVMIDLVTTQAPSTPRRNAPCPCGSGRKYKRCCAVSPPTSQPVRKPARA